MQGLVESSLLVDPASTSEKKKKTKKQATQPTALPWWKRRIPVPVAIAAGLGGLVCGWLFGVLISIKKPDGTMAQIEVPDGSHVTIDDQGNASVGLAKRNGRSDSDSKPISADDLGIAPIHRLHGIWVAHIVREESGVPVSQDKHEFTMAISNGKFAVVHENEMQITGSIRSAGSSRSPKLELIVEKYSEPTAGGTRAFPDSFEVVPEFLEGNRVHLNYVGMEVKNTKSYFHLGLAISGRAIIDYPSLAQDSAISKRTPDRLKALGWAYEQLTGRSTEAAPSSNSSAPQDQQVPRRKTPASPSPRKSGGKR